MDKVRKNFVPANVEHLELFPPIARWYDGEIVEAEDGHAELFLVGRPLPQQVLRSDVADRVPDFSGYPFFEASDPVRIEMSYEPRNFSQADREAFSAAAPFPLSEDVRWASLPPTEWIISFTVAWAAVQFATGFFQEIGRTTASAVLAWIKNASAKAREPARDAIVTLRFVLDEERYVQGMIILPSGGMGKPEMPSRRQEY